MEERTISQQEFLNDLADYPKLSWMLKNYSYKQILEVASASINVSPGDFEQYPVSTFFINKEDGRYRSILHEMLKNIIHYDWLFSRLQDEASRQVFTYLAAYRVLPGQVFLKKAFELTDDKFQSIKLSTDKCEINYLLNHKKYIRDKSPALAFYVHHDICDIWEIAKLLHMIRPEYRFYIRHFSESSYQNTVIYALPPENRIQPLSVRKKRKRIVAMAVNDGWDNVQLVKECGTFPYLLYKNYGCDASMVGSYKEEYTNLKYIEGVKMEYLPDGKLQTKVNYLMKESGEIDCLLLRGCYPNYYAIADTYKKYNPQGKICLFLDANSEWMDRISWAEPNFALFMQQCDVICASGHTMQRHLNEKWPWTIEYIPNGFYNFSNQAWNIDFDKKKNRILTVGRLGTPQKATEVLLEAFARIAEKIPEWELRLVGGCTIKFESYLAQYWEKHPQLKGRIHLVGKIVDRESLYQEYLDAKIFALPSVIEGGTPNVIAEALSAGDAIAITKIDEYNDAIDRGRCGLASQINDIKGFSDILLSMCQDKKLVEKCNHAYEYAKSNFNMERLTAKLYTLIFNEEI